MGDTPVRSGHPLDDEPDRTPLERAVAAHRHGASLTVPLGATQQRLFDDLLPWLDALHAAAPEVAHEPISPGVEPPARETGRAEDPVARMLGLIASQDSAVDGRKLARARKAAGLDLGQFVAQLRARGWEVATNEALRWELGRTVLPPALVSAMASELGVSEGALFAASTVSGATDDLLSDARVAAFIADWAAEADMEQSEVRRRARGLLVGAGRRNSTTGSVDALLEVLRTLRAIPGFLRQS